MRILLVAAICKTILATSGVAQDSENLARNGGFEEWPEKPADAPAWGASHFAVGVDGRDEKPAGRAYRTGEGELDTERHSGKFAQYIQTNTWGRGAISAGVPVTAGHRYRVSAWVKTLTGTFQMGVCFSHKPWTYLGDWVVAVANSQWTQFEKEVVIPAGCSAISAVHLFQTGSGYLDDLEIVDLGPAEEEELDGMPLLQGGRAGALENRSVAILDEPGFPSESPRDPGWYEKVLKEAGQRVTRLGLAQLVDKSVFNPERFDVLILPTGGNAPADLEDALVGFLAGGGTVLIDGSMVLRTEYQPPKEVQDRLRELKKAYEAGGDAYAYWDYVAKNDSYDYANVFVFDEENRKWRNKLSLTQNYEYINFEHFLNDLCVSPWPNTGQARYARPFSLPVHRNPEMNELLSGFPETIPPEDEPSAHRGAVRLARPGGKGHGSAMAEEHALDLLVPLYLFDEPSGQAYPGYVEAGKEPKDREADFYIVRYNNPLLRGGTLIHCGNLGKRILSSAEGAGVLVEVLKIAEAELPGEVPKDYVDGANQARRLFSEYSGVSLKYRDVCAKLARPTFYQGNDRESASLKEEYQTEKAKFERLAARAQELEKLLFNREQKSVWGHRQRLAFVKELEAELARLEPLTTRRTAQLEAVATPPEKREIQYPLDRIFFGLGHADTHRGATRSLDLRKRIEAFGLRWEGYGVSSYRHDYTFNQHPFKSEFQSGQLDPRTGMVEPVTFRWMTTDEEKELWVQSFRWQLERAAKHPEINLVFGMDERNFDFSLWGPRMRELLIGHLGEKYSGIEELNRLYGADYASFEDIELPLKRPESQSEHALWEDWTRYREIYRYEEEMMPSITAVTRYAPELLYIPWSSNYLNERKPASGINYYEYGQALHEHPPKFKINGFEHGNSPEKEWFVFDVVSMHSRNATAEWGAFYFPPAAHQQKADLLTQGLWNGIVNGQVGWDFFQFSNPGASGASYFDMVNLPLPLGWQLDILNADLQRLAPVVLDGKREEAPVRIVYSNTNRRHTSWPDVEGDISFRAVGGLYDFFKRTHLHARAIDEQAIWQGHLSPECKLLILPEISYQNQELFERVTRFLEAGGTVLVTPGSGTYDEYGRRRDSWFALAGVKPVPVTEPTIPLGRGLTYFSAGHRERMAGIEPLFPEEVEILARFADGVPALTRTGIGKGQLFVLGVDLGQDCALQWAGNPAVVSELIRPVLETAGLGESDIQLNNPGIVVRPWRYDGQRFLLLTDARRENFQNFEMAIAGDWKVQDYLLGIEIPSEFDGKQTRLKGLIASPGGVVYALSEGGRGTSAGKPAPSAAKDQAAEPAPEPVPENTGLTISEGTPFEGRIWVDQGRIRAGDFHLELDVVTGGGWGGEMFLTASQGDERHRRRCVAGETIVFEFARARLKVDVQEIVSVYPGNLRCRVEIVQPEQIAEACKVVREEFLGQESILISNGIIAFRLLPGLGGRMIELVSLPDRINHLAVDEEAIRQSAGAQGWSDFGGMGENAGGWPGPFWRQPFKVTEIEETPERVRVRLEMKEAVEWRLSHGKPQGGNNRLVKEFTLARNSAEVEVSLRNYNAHKTAMPAALRTHPKFRVGGDADPSDTWFIEEAGEASTRQFPFGSFGAQIALPAKGGWSALVDTARKIALVNTFDPEAVDTVYLNSQPEGYNVELWLEPREIEGGDALEFSHSMMLMRGLSGVVDSAQGVVVNIDQKVGDGSTGSGKLEFIVEAGSPRTLDATVRASIIREGTSVVAFDPVPINLPAGRAHLSRFQWDSAGQPDGEYQIVASVTNTQGEELVSAHKTFRVSAGPGQAAEDSLAEYSRQIQLLRAQYAHGGGRPDGRALRTRIARAEILVDKLRQELLAGDSAAAEVTGKQLEELLGPAGPET